MQSLLGWLLAKQLICCVGNYRIAQRYHFGVSFLFILQAFITFGSRRDELFVRGRLCLPNPDCAVCHNHRALVYANPETLCLRTILSDLLEDFVFKLREQQVENDLNFEDHALLPNLEELSDEVCILEGSRIIYDPEMSSDGTALDRTLADFGIADGSLLRLDFLEGPALILGIIKE